MAHLPPVQRAVVLSICRAKVLELQMREVSANGGPMKRTVALALQEENNRLGHFGWLVLEYHAARFRYLRASIGEFIL